MEVTHYVVPARAYPRYRYTIEHVVPLLHRFRTLSKQCNITDPFEIPPFGDVNIYIISDNGTDIISVEELTPKSEDGIKQIKIKCKDTEEFREKCPDIAATIHVASYSKACQTESHLFEYLGQCNVLLVEDDEEAKVETPDFRTTDDRITSVKPRKNVAKQMGYLLERIIFQELTKRVRILAAIVEVDSAHAALATLDQDVANLLKLKFDPSRSMSASRQSFNVDRDVINLHEAWCSARLLAIQNKIRSEYGKQAKEVIKQLLGTTEWNGRKIEALKICEQILPYVHDETIQSESDRIPQKIVDQTRALQKSHEYTMKAIELEQRFKTHLELVESNKDDLIQLYGESMSMYQRSMIPPHEKPSQKKMREPPPPLSEQVAKELLSLKGVTGCGYRFWTLDIYINYTVTDEVQHIVEVEVQNIAEKHSISDFKIRKEQGEITKFAEYEVGSTLTSRHDRSASLGGFALKGKTEDLSLLVARHFADEGKPVYVRDEEGNKRVFAQIIPPTKPEDRVGTLDIAAGLVLKRERPKCNTLFKGQCGTPLASRLSMFEQASDIARLQGLPVHIWGAKSSPGLGKIIIPDFYIEGMKRLVKIEDRHPVNGSEIVPFSKEGDSGAIVCADDPEGEEVHVVSMVSGASNYLEKQNNPNIKGEYLSIRLKDGLVQLEEVYGDTFRLC